MISYANDASHDEISIDCHDPTERNILPSITFGISPLLNTDKEYE